MNLAISNVLTLKIYKIPSLENKGAEWAHKSELVIARTARMANNKFYLS